MSIYRPVTAALLALFALSAASCAGPQSPAPGVGAPRPEAPPAVRSTLEDFARGECALYARMKERERACTLADNAEAGQVWLETVSGEAVDRLSREALLGAVQRSLRAAERITAGELADVGWFLAEALRTRFGGRYAWDRSREQIILTLASSSAPPLAPMILIEKCHRGQVDLTQTPGLAGPPARPTADEPGCRGVRRADVLELRLAGPAGE